MKNLLIVKDLEWISPLIEEIKQENPKLKIKSGTDLPLVFIDQVKIKNFSFGFCTAMLPGIIEIPADSISIQAQNIITEIEKQHHSTLLIHVFSISKKIGIVTNGRAAILQEKLKRKYKSTISSLFIPKKIVQVLINDDRSLYLSIISEEEYFEYFQNISLYPGGYTKTAQVDEAPSRAYKKILEAQKVMGLYFQKGETLVDLGASPGGWSYIALMKGMKVTALDRSPLREDLMKMDTLEFIKADAFKYNDKNYVDWVISDIICLPDRIIELIKNWVLTEKCKYFIFTIKFKGQDDYPVLQKIKEVLRIQTHYKWFIRQLNANKNEVTLMGIKST